MKFTTLITALVLGTTAVGGVASAQPAWGNDAYARHHRRAYNRVPRGDSHEYDAGRAYGWVPPNYPYGDDYRDHRSDMTLIQGVPVPPTPDRQNLHLDQVGPLHRLRIQVTRGATFVTEVGVVFPGSENRPVAIPVNRWLDARGDSTAVIDLPGRVSAVNGLLVYTQGGRATYDLIGE